MSRSSSKVRPHPRLAIPNPVQGQDEVRSADGRSHPLSANPSPHSRVGSIDARSVQSHRSRNASPMTHSRLPSLQMGEPFVGSPGLPTGKTITQATFNQNDTRPISRGRLGPQDVLPLEDLLPPPPIGGGSFMERMNSPNGSRTSSRSRGGHDSVDLSSGQGSRNSSPAPVPMTPTSAKLNKKRGWLSGRHGKNENTDVKPEPWSFIVGTPEKIDYDLSQYIARRPVAELWTESGDLYVHLFGENAGPSFKLDSIIIESSKSFQRLLDKQPRSREPSVADIDRGVRNVSLGSNRSLPKGTPDADGRRHLYIPLQFPSTGELRPDDLENLIAVRNLFGFLTGQILVGTPKQPTLYAVFKNIAGLLAHYEFTNADESTHGEVAKLGFLGYVEDLRLDDLRSSREKTLQALVLGELMKSWPLYNEGYVHAVGKWDEIHAMKPDTIRFITPMTRKRMEKSHIDLENRLRNINRHLIDFEFPSLFSGIAASSAFSKAIDTKLWRSSWNTMKRFTTNFYKTQYGAWPPKASSKKNDFEESGLNRIVLKALYQDFSDLYDMLVDKENLTTRSVDMAAHDVQLSSRPRLHWLRQLMSEFDRSSPPVKPPIPYDICLLPDMRTIRRDFDSLPDKRQMKEKQRKLKPDEINLALMQSYDREAMRATPFLVAYMEHERKEYQGKCLDEMIDCRIGQWIFLYVILQSLPLVVVDAPGVKWTEGVEYFLCEAPKSTPPWSKAEAKQILYRIGDGSGMVKLPVDAISNSAEGIYERSHCWEMAKIWSHGAAQMPVQAKTVAPTSKLVGRNLLDHPELAAQIEDLQAPPSLARMGRNSWASSPGTSPRNSVALGLEELPLPPPIRADVGVPSRKVSTPDISKTFDDILGPATPVQAPKKKGWGSFSG